MQTTFKGKPVSGDDIVAVIREFDEEHPDSNSYDSWLEKGTYKYAVEYEGKLYPCKYLLSQATGIDTSQFGGGEQTNSVLRKLGFQVVRRDDNLHTDTERLSPIHGSRTGPLKNSRGDKSPEGEFDTRPIARLDWDLLERHRIARKDDRHYIIQPIYQNPADMIRRMRTILEKIADYLLRLRGAPGSTAQNLNLADKIRQLESIGVFSPKITTYSHLLRRTGNEAVHGGEVTQRDVNVVLPAFVTMVEWFVTEYLRQAT